jgi:Coenzyme PQQ synthesis protein D (PqqD)
MLPILCTWPLTWPITLEAELDTQTEVVRREGVIAERLLEEMVVLNLDENAYVRLNATGRWIWEQLSAPRSLASLANELAAEFEIDRQRALTDVTAFVRGLVERGLAETRA